MKSFKTILGAALALLSISAPTWAQSTMSPTYADTDGTRRTVMPVFNVGSGATGTSASQVQGNVASGAADSGNPVKVGGKYNLTVPTFADGQRGDLQLGSRGSLRVEVMGAGGATGAVTSSVSSDAATTSTTSLATQAFGYDFNGSSWDRRKKPSATSRIVSAAATTNATVAKASAGDLFTVTGYNAAATARYLKFYNKATSPTVGTDTPVLTIALPPTSAVNINLHSHYFSAGISYALTTGAADADTGALTLADVVGLNVTYQ